ncbi:MAG: UDP-N-acetylglucosamine pyrophosphorylase [Clostridia bacterium]|nr:UDP-N-acetylglucosamine pyrophosphorylase [Clostridia bacterium]
MEIITELFTLEHTVASEIFKGCTYPHEALTKINDFILNLGKSLPKDLFYTPKEGVWIAKSAKVASTASISAPCIIDENAEIRHCAFIRENAIVGKNAIVGNSTELKNVILFDGVQVPHYNYVGDSIIGYKSHLGAGAITSNVKMDKSLVFVSYGKERICSGYKKLGAILGDFVEVGCGAVLNPGTVVGKNTSIYPLTSVRGYIKENSIYKSAEETLQKLPCEKEKV